MLCRAVRRGRIPTRRAALCLPSVRHTIRQRPVSIRTYTTTAGATAKEGVEWWIWGSCDEGQFGLGQKEQKAPSPIPHTALNKLKPKKISLGSNHTVVITSDSDVYAWGQNREGQLGVGDKECRVEPTRVSIKTPKPPVDVIAGSHQTFFILRDDAGGDREIWASGLLHEDKTTDPVQSLEPVPLEFIPQEIQSHTKTIYAGHFFHFILTDQKELYAFGVGENGQLARKSRYEKIPQLIDLKSVLKEDEVVINVKTGWGHVLILTSEGRVFSWGHNMHGQCGVGTTESLFAPQQVKLPKDITIKRIASGSTHSLLVDANGDVLSFGSHKDGKLGLSNVTSDVLTPTYIPALADKSVTLVGVGCDHSAVVTENNELYTWGFGQHGVLGHGDYVDRPVPTLVPPFTDGVIIDIEGGMDVTLAAVTLSSA